MNIDQREAACSFIGGVKALHRLNPESVYLLAGWLDTSHGLVVDVEGADLYIIITNHAFKHSTAWLRLLLLEMRENMDKIKGASQLQVDALCDAIFTIAKENGVIQSSNPIVFTKLFQGE